MIPNQWYAVLESHEIKKGKVVGVARMGENLVVWRNSQGVVSIMSDRCPHRGVALSVGKLIGDRIQCPFHGFEYDSTGSCKLVPANGRAFEPPKALRVNTYPTQEAHDFIYIWWGDPRDEYPPLPWFESIPDTMVYSALKDHWANHYSRAIENQLDVVHLPFIHHNTIGRGNRTLVNGPIATEENHWPGDHLINLWVYNEKDDGQKPKKASELPKPDRRPFLQFRYGNLWQNWIADNLRIILAFAPIDNENTMMYLRYYHTMRIPVLRQLYGWLGSLGNFIIERQDRGVVITQRPHRPDLGTGEILIPGDNPVVLYRKIRRTLIEESGKNANVH
jgi:phenylpropionate dioxygenase-like ring-hydroxylating dioxygenase large terminal subunit